MKKILLSTISLVVFTGVASAATNEELLQEIKALKAENAALRSKAHIHNDKVARNYSNKEYSSALPNIKGQSAVSPAPLWTGFYAGLNAGYGFGTANGGRSVASPLSNYPGVETTPEYFTNPLFPALANTANISFDQNGFIGGGQVGYNYQVETNFVIGLEADIQGSSIRGSGNYVGTAVTDEAEVSTGIVEDESAYTALGYGRVEGGVNWFGTVRGRLGYLITPTMLVFGTGGLVYGGVYENASHNFSMTYLYRNQIFNSAGNIGTANSTRTGWTAGGGIEWMFMPNWSIKGEALYYDLGSQNIATAAFTYGNDRMRYPEAFVGSIQNTQVQYNGIFARAGVNYHFNLASIPVVANF